MSKETKLQVEAIKNGTVIDHIPAKVGIKVLKLFDMHNPRSVSPSASICRLLPSAAKICSRLKMCSSVKRKPTNSRCTRHTQL